jgi:hypothetical protein
MTTRFKLEMEGITPLMVHNGQLADPMNPYVRAMKELTGKRKKSEEDIALLARIEWQGSLYMQNGSIVMSNESIEACLNSGARIHKLGKVIKGRVLAFATAEETDPSVSPIIEFGMKNGGFGTDIPDGSLDKVYIKCRDYRSVKVGTARVMRCRPVFATWRILCGLEVREGINLADFHMVVDAAQREGLCEYRPKYGQFKATLTEV